MQARITAFTHLNNGFEDVYIGNVNVDNRIFTDDKLTVLGPNQFKITPAPIGKIENVGTKIVKGVVQKPQPVPGIAKAIIDGREFQGKEIMVDGPTVIVSPYEEIKMDVKNVTKEELKQQANINLDGSGPPITGKINKSTDISYLKSGGVFSGSVDDVIKFLSSQEPPTTPGLGRR